VPFGREFPLFGVKALISTQNYRKNLFTPESSIEMRPPRGSESAHKEPLLEAYLKNRKICRPEIPSKRPLGDKKGHYFKAKKGLKNTEIH
jgi:hypothetical protein